VIVKLSRYFVVGGVAAIVEWLSFAALFYQASVNYVVSAVLAFAVAWAVNYWLSLKFVFTGGRHPKQLEALYVGLVSMVGAGINIGAMVMLVEWAGLPVMPAKIIGTGATFFWNFLVRHFLIFER